MQLSTVLEGRSGLNRFCGYTECTVPDPDGFALRAVAFRLGSIIVARTRMTPADLTPVSRRFEDSVVVVVPLSGRITVRSGRNDVVLEPGQALFDIGWGRRSSRHTDTVEAVILLVPTAVARSRGIDLSDGAVVCGSPAVSASVRALGRLTAPIATGDAAERTGAAAGPIEAAVLELVAGVFAEGSPPGADSPSTLRSRADAVIARSYVDPALTVTVVARKLSVSVRSLHRAYAGSGTTVAAEIRRRRCDHAESLLAATVGTGRVDLASIAAASGFPSVVDLRRAVSSRHSMSVTSYRASLPGNHVPLTTSSAAQ